MNKQHLVIIIIVTVPNGQGLHLKYLVNGWLFVTKRIRHSV